MPRKRSTKRKKIKSSDNVEGKNSLRFLSNKHKVSPSTTFREIYEQTSRTPCWEQVTAYMKYNQLPGIRVVSMDITWLGKIQGKPRWVLLVTDALSGDKVVYQPMDNQKAYTLVEILQRLKKTGYIPSIVIIDGAGALRTAVERVYPDAEIQRCLIHLQRNVYLSKELKPRKSGKPRKDGYTKRILLQVQKQLINAAWA